MEVKLPDVLKLKGRMRTALGNKHQDVQTWTEAAKDYKNTFKEVVNIINKDMLEGVKISFKGGSFTPGSKDRLDQFLSEVSILNTKRTLKNIAEETANKVPRLLQCSTSKRGFLPLGRRVLGSLGPRCIH